MDKAPNKFMSVVYQLYTIADGEKTLEEQTSTEQPFEFITGFSIATIVKIIFFIFLPFLFYSGRFVILMPLL